MMSTAFIILSLEIILLVLAFQNYKNNDILKAMSSFYLILFMVLISGFRYNVGDDFLNYEIMFDNPNHIRNLYTEPIWRYISLFLHGMKLSSISWFLLTSFIINLFFITGIKSLSKNFYISVAFYLIMPHMFLESFNIVRQFVAMSIIFRFSYLFFSKKYIKFLLIILLASCFHKSAILTIPLFFLSLLYFSNFVLITIVCVCFILRNSFLPLIIEIISNISMYAGYANELIASESNSGLYAFFLLILSLFIIFCFWKNKEKKICIIKNLSLMSFCIYLMFYTFQAGQRIGFYLLPYFILLVPYIKTKFKINGSFITIGGIFTIFMLFTLKAGFIQMYQFRF